MKHQTKLNCMLIMQTYITIYKCSSKIYNAENEMTLSTSCSLSGSALCRLAVEKL